MTTKVQKWGNSLAVRLPRALAHESRLSVGTNISITAGPKGTVVIRAEKQDATNLNSIVTKITTGNIHTEVLWGKYAGKEVW
jgi:antitoxin MazE